MTTTPQLTDEQVFAIAEQHGIKHRLMDEKKFGQRWREFHEMPVGQRWSANSVEAEQTLAFARSLLAQPAAMPSAEWLAEAHQIIFSNQCVLPSALLAHLSKRIAPDEAVKDAARYRWLRDGDLSAEYPYPVMRVGSFGRTDYAIWAEELDAAIDSAMEKEKAK